MGRTPPPNRQGKAKTRITRGPDVLRKPTHTNPQAHLGSIYLRVSVNSLGAQNLNSQAGSLREHKREAYLQSSESTKHRMHACGRVSTPSTGVVSSAPPSYHKKHGTARPGVLYYRKAQ